MSPIIGFALLLLVFSINIFLPFFNFFSLKKAQKNSAETIIFHAEKVSSSLTLCAFLAALLSQFCLIYSFIISDYSVTNVYQNSHHLKPLIYKISGSWGNHEGSMLLLIRYFRLHIGFQFFSKNRHQKKTNYNLNPINNNGSFCRFYCFYF